MTFSHFFFNLVHFLFLAISHFFIFSFAQNYILCLYLCNFNPVCAKTILTAVLNCLFYSFAFLNVVVVLVVMAGNALCSLIMCDGYQSSLLHFVVSRSEWGFVTLQRGGHHFFIFFFCLIGHCKFFKACFFFFSKLDAVLVFFLWSNWPAYYCCYSEGLCWGCGLTGECGRREGDWDQNSNTLGWSGLLVIFLFSCFEFFFR